MSRATDKEACAAAAAVCACFNLRKASRAVTQHFNAVLQPCGLRSTQFVVLVVARAEEPVLMTRLAGALVMDRSTLLRNLKPLEKAGLVKRSRIAGQRSHSVRLTAKGRRALETAVPLWQKAQESFVEKLGGVRFKSLLSALSAVA